MTKTLTIKVDAAVYRGLQRDIGRRSVSRYVEELVSQHVAKTSLDKAYADMSRDHAREREALEWADATCGDGCR